ncbi:sterol C-14 reductase-like protein [Aulographum hederae CBS 113979]|uniref:Delta(14)-sterol reductase n=1 Tax=Aulographum hederae CBS 113979 TaxID=1176131 RepID=A0A6G1GWK0_9PEZI|nr:sterol C-14 reductase-like protein [Aulographum hederae CBS 113979]
MATSKAASAPPVEKHGYEFGGPIGASLISFGLPVACYAATFLCNDVSGCPAPSVLHPSTLTLDALKREVGWKGFSGLLNTKALLAAIGWYVLSLVLYAALPAVEVQGVPLRSGARLTYRFNTFTSSVFIMSLAGLGTLIYGSEFILWTFIWENHIPLLTSSILISWTLATYVYISSFSVKYPNKEHRELAAGGITGNLIYDWYIGRELNPRITIPLIGEVDIKAFMELRPGLLGWVLLDCAFVARQYYLHGTLTMSILIVTFTQALYVFDAFLMEPAILTTIDIIADGFGNMLAFGDLTWVPFIYSLQARYLAVHPVALGFWGCVGVFAVQGTGYYVFRSANNEKNRFRSNPGDPRIAHLKFMETKSGSRLLTSGWWGTARHINYLGDWFMSWAFCLPTGLAGYVIETQPMSAQKIVVPGEAKGWGMLFTYFYLLYFAILLIHRERRDEEKCRRKYGKDWEEYCKKVPYRIVPGIY